MVAAPLCRMPIPHWQEELAHSSKLESIAHAARGPFHVLYPQNFTDTARLWLDTAADTGITFGLRFGKKSNKAGCFARNLADLYVQGNNAGIDVASTDELRAALCAGLPGEQLVVTGPTPTAELIRLAAYHGSLITISRPEDIDVIAGTICNIKPTKSLRILLRLSSDGAHTRFGMSLEQSYAVAQTLESGRYQDLPLDIAGVSFHCNGYDLDERIRMAHKAIDAVLKLREWSSASIVSIGGGFPTSSISPELWNAVTEQLTPSMFVTGRVPGDQYPFAANCAGAEALRYILTQGTTSLKDKAISHGITILAEPGRSLCQAAGASYFPVLSCHELPNTEGNVTVVEGTSLSLSEQWFDSEYYPDPYLIRAGKILSQGNPTDSAVAGSTCLDSDYLSRRFIRFPDRPQPGDILVYPDTAGYQMDSNESSFHGKEPPKKFVFSTTPHHHFTEDFS
ncbi:type III PLP-dependent enzyme domain-containing protein [Corynebacterium pseudotuberculosis]|uniref:alanine racemase n=1 Tax=Corynebacterium pseudotuberculosis TaxID=1719 RepID=UPI002279CEDA|nr:alanine racemase [Corynebacterium pseudotuberculosis]WAE85627.1 alanine racemase [Corynebacterium pseudotuberculosis]WAE87681.1 alanine racemase [Corynebacterium pseudotuberculosis]